MDINRIYDLLTEIEWGGWDNYADNGPHCPYCHAYDNNGHVEGCELKAILEELEREP